jgi:hypothetical protein
LDLGVLTPIRTPLGKDICKIEPKSCCPEVFASTNSVLTASLCFNLPDLNHYDAKLQHALHNKRVLLLIIPSFSPIIKLKRLSRKKY